LVVSILCIHGKKHASQPRDQRSVGIPAGGLLMEQRIKQWLDSRLFYKDIGWEEIGEFFRRYPLFRCKWFKVFIHHLSAHNEHRQCHDHPWSFVTLILWRGYLEQVGDKRFRRRAGSILYRPAEFAHNVTTPYGPSWSIVIVSKEKRDWGFLDCQPKSNATD